MKKFLKKCYEIIGEFGESIISILGVLIFSKFNANSYFRAEKKKREEGDVCYVLCNGPSLQNFLNMGDIPSKNLFVVNFFGNSEAFMKIKPDNYFVLDNILIGRATQQRMARSVEAVNRLYENLSSVTWAMNFFFPSDGDKKLLDKLKGNNNITICIYNKTPVSGLKGLSHFLYRKNLGMPRPQNISNAAIFCAINSGYKKIYLYGVEHSWQKAFDVDPETHRIFANDGHFYQKDNIRYYNRGDYCKVLLNHHLAFKSHFMLREYADSLNTKIINRTATSFIEAYEFDEY